MSAEAIDRLAELVVRFAANVQPGQIVAIGTEPGKLELTRAIAAAAYRAGAKFVDVSTSTCTSSARGSCTPTRTRSTTCRRGTASGSSRSATPRGARIGLTGPGAPGLLTTSIRRGPAATSCRSSRSRPRSSTRARRTGPPCPCPTPPWARSSSPTCAGREAMEQLWEQVLHICRLDEDDPVAAWRERAGRARRRQRAADRAGASTRCTSRARAPTCASGCCRRRAGCRRASRRSTGSCTCRTCRPRRSSRRPTRSASTASCASTKPLVVGGTIVARPARALRGRPGGLDRRRRGRRAAAPVRRARRGRVAPRRGRAGRRRGPHRPARTRSSTTR